MATQDLLYTKDKGVAWITLNRPERLNAYTGEMMDAWYDALVDARDDDDVRAIVVTGEGRGFCSGIDLRDRAEREAQAEAEGHPLPAIAQQRSRLRNGSYRFHRLLAQMDKPYIAAVNGAAAGAGMDMASMCDIRIASDQARFTMAYINMAVVPDQGACYFLPRIVGIARALDLIWTGRVFNAQEALEMGYVSSVVPHDRLLDEVGEYARQLARQPAVGSPALQAAPLPLPGGRPDRRPGRHPAGLSDNPLHGGRRRGAKGLRGKATAAVQGTVAQPPRTQGSRGPHA